jgi:transposase
MLIFAMDLGSSKSAFCLLDTETLVQRAGTCPTQAAKLRKLLDRHRPALVVVEISPLAAMVHDVAQELGLAIQVADTTQDAWRWRNVKRKTDRDDALKLAKLAALGQINPVHIPNPRMRQWRALVRYRQTLVAERTRIKNRVRQLVLVQAGQRLPLGNRGWTERTRVQLRALARPLEECAPDELWRGMLASELDHLLFLAEMLHRIDQRLNRLGRQDARCQLVQTLPGVGPRVAEALVTTLDQADRFTNRRQVSAYAGLTPRRYQSGQMDRSGHISKRGDRLLRSLLNQAAWQAVIRDPYFRALYERIGRGCKARRKIAIVAVMRHLLVIAWAMLRDQQVYQPARLARAAA